MALKLREARERIRSIFAKNGKDAADVIRAILDGDLEGDFNLLGLRARSFFYDDFLAAAIDGRLSSTAGAGTGNAVATTVAGAINGTVTLKSASDSGTTAQNGSMITFDQLNWKANQGGCFFEARLQVDVITNCYFFVGFTDTISTTVEYPLSLSSNAVASDATNAAGIVFDTSATTDVLTLCGVKADVDTAQVKSGIAPVAATYITLGVELTAAGAAIGYINGAKFGEVANAVTITTALTPCIAVGNRAAEQKVLTIDYLAVTQNR